MKSGTVHPVVFLTMTNRFCFWRNKLLPTSKGTNLPLFLFVQTFLFLRLNLTDDDVSAVYITVYLLLAAGHYGFGALPGHLAIVVAIPAFGDCSRWRFCAFKRIDHAAGESGSPVVTRVTF